MSNLELARQYIKLGKISVPNSSIDSAASVKGVCEETKLPEKISTKGGFLGELWFHFWQDIIPG